MIDGGMALARWPLSWLPPAWQTVLALPLLIGLVLIGLIVVVKLFPVVDRVLGPVGGGLASALGLLAALPEYMITMVLRHSGRKPPAMFHTYGDAVENMVMMGRRISAAGLTGFTSDGRIRRLLIAIALCLIVAVGNANSCPAASPCRPPIPVWWSQTRALFTTPHAGLHPKPSPTTTKKKGTKKATTKPTPKRTGS